MTQGGFQFDLCGRNAYLEARGIKPPRFTKTGTTIAGLVFKVNNIIFMMILLWSVSSDINLSRPLIYRLF